MRSMSIIQRIAAGFGIIILLLILVVLMAWQAGLRLGGQVETLSSEVAPTLVQSRAVTRILFSEDKQLRNLLTQQEPQAVRRDMSQLETWQQHFDSELERLKTTAGSVEGVSDKLASLSEQQQIYWQQAQQLVKDYAANLEQQAALLKQNTLTTTGKQFNADLTMLVSTLGAHYTVGLSRSLMDNLDLLVSNTQESLNQHDPQTVGQRLQANRHLASKVLAQRKELAAALAEQESAFGGSIDFEATVGKKLDTLLHETTADNGLLAHHLQLTEQSQQLRNQSEQSARIIDAVLAELSDVDAVIDNRLQQSVTQTGSVLTQLKLALVIGLAVSLLLAIVVLWRVIAAIRQPMKLTLSALQGLTEGDMTQRIAYQKSDEFGHLARGINALATQMRNMLEQIVDSANELGVVAERNQTTLQQTNRQLEQQRLETASVATAMVEMEHTVADVAKAANQSMTSVVRVTEQAYAGRQISDSNIQRINRLANELNASQQVIEKVHGLSVNIGGILDVISQIAEQTNLLALNAAIEAARAGEQGRGFAVVADEVRSLARRTADATTEIQNMINALQQSVGAAVDAIRVSGQAMSACTNESEQAKQAMDAISLALQEVTDMSSQIAAAAEEQQCTSAEIARNLNTINEIAEQNRKEIDQVADTSDQLQQLSTTQRELVRRFTL
ncbi:methyl-accepting chemotaxis protein [Pseudaeromonas sharmana]|uniref:Methyl-accepting chemotaxis protein n=1 Tax=Pseudaeromonas sharmana TaxID=328412 RepID=A0ABV8CIE8_9GAMM